VGGNQTNKEKEITCNENEIKVDWRRIVTSFLLC